MPIPEDQLETWSHQGAINQSANTYSTIRQALESNSSNYANRTTSIYLQGSYSNDTNIYSESDVDVVIELGRSIFYHDLAALPQPEKDAFAAAHHDADYSHADFKRDVLANLQGKFPQYVNTGKKAIKVLPHGNRRSADVVVAVEFRRYHRFRSTADAQFDKGICFFLPDGTRIANYPRQHSANCTEKHQATDSRFKPLVRIFKNMRTRLVEDGLLADGVAPSYYIEGLLYNVPKDNFAGSFGNAFTNCFNWLWATDRSDFVCANYQYYLFRGDPNVTWNTQNCDAYLQALRTLWEHW